MGFVKLTGRISDAERTRTEELEFLVDAGVSYMVIPRTIAEDIGLRTMQKTGVTLAGKRETDAGNTFAYIRILGRSSSDSTNSRFSNAAIGCPMSLDSTQYYYVIL